ncbi:hypothetical protein QVD17_34093 [Tagetes erecta]|uniref:Uncharacterized protein n=1 Tax=Tagetes erecta TaxID=13708 RepID=A0AAD8JZ82_TARER|nr:hypothetical protein QVD17_34093 [Tagetes erecta]
MANDLYLPSTCKFNTSFLCSFIISHPLYFSYFIFFSPYLFKFFFFISPLFFTTSILVFLSIIATTFPQSKLGILQSLQSMVDRLRLKINNVDHDNEDEFRDFEELEIYKIVFDDPPLVTVTVGDGDGDEAEDKQIVLTENAVTEKERRLDKLFEELDRFDESTVAIEETNGELRKLGLYVEAHNTHETDETSFSVKSDPWRFDSSSSFGSCESLMENETRSNIVQFAGKLTELKPVTSSSTVQSNSRSHVREVLQKLEPVNVTISGDNNKTVHNNSVNSFSVKSNSVVPIDTQNSETRSRVREAVRKFEPKLMPVSISDEDNKTVDNTFCERTNLWRQDSSSSFGSYGSMRKEKEWKRTLACKLFEERNNTTGGEEGMDSLWEAYEDDNASRKSRTRKECMSSHGQKKKMMKNKNKSKKSEFKCFDEVEEDEDEDDDEDEFMNNGQLCCLKALKLSTGKMNLGMGKPNLVKISKAFKGFGWLHHVGSNNKHAKRN